MARPRLQVVAPTPPAARRAPFVGLVVGVLGLGLLGLLGLNTALAQGAFHQHDLERQLAALQDQEQALQQHVAALAAPHRLSAKAHRLGMVATVNPAFLRARDGKVLGRPVPGAASSFAAPPAPAQPMSGDERPTDPRGLATPTTPQSTGSMLTPQPLLTTGPSTTSTKASARQPSGDPVTQQTRNGQQTSTSTEGAQPQ
ncbi:MAG: septum formation initiator family protein [Actinomycetes bacterium]